MLHGRRGPLRTQDGSGSAGGEALEAAGFEVELEPSQSGLRLLRVDLLVGGGVGEFTASGLLCLVLSGCASRYQNPA